MQLAPRPGLSHLAGRPTSTVTTVAASAPASGATGIHRWAPATVAALAVRRAARGRCSRSCRRAEGEQVVTPWEVEAGDDGVDYDKLIETFGCQPITAEQIERIEKLTGKRAHRFLRRGLFFSHRDLDELLNAYEKGEKFYIYTGRGPSSESLHLGHLVPFLFTKWLQEAFDVPLVIELTDDEKFLFKKDLSIDESRRLAWENAKDIIACGFDPAKTFIFRDTDYIQQLYPVTLQIQKRVSMRTAQNTFGFTLSDNIGKVSFAAVQASPAFAIAFPDFLEPGRRCFIPQAIDQDPYFRLCRRVADDLKWPKPACIHSKFLPALQGHQTKMSASVASTALYMTDTEKILGLGGSTEERGGAWKPMARYRKLRKKINKHAFSGGGKTEEEQRANGANLDVDVAYQYLKIWLEDDEDHGGNTSGLPMVIHPHLGDTATPIFTRNHHHPSAISAAIFSQNGCHSGDFCCGKSDRKIAD
ncbi:unnamed protein product [Cladocopium goreaui]|uniref:Tryptophan--tRNA ligase, cytoplasmic n=1 Tax=Cladocopium goreaui TaxID=2562237 RepID=A0A9P1D361_9DINO|nr:unnamed protein product [Cladocopium goreaui]